ncbi:DNA/RNA non-specific endonuclease [Pseudarthrobacter sp. L1SW]|uniref:DNA/RNA non-specific endonuclease n=1 Tax=Pseudarthrobacter sp. L1SW TaxID=2851598 RepID=UPI001E454706|nr:DNA/RNA non-specific endonuclease [Pseudarthrobacter sp. L1SW]UEL29228.1 DNA/RNA non-specific endonuclease [Pseudarthrobacter sp. L1SW]
MDELLTAAAATTVDLANRKGLDEDFLDRRVPLPGLPGADTVLLPYTHFSVLMRLDKRLAAVTGLGIDGGKLMDLDRDGINWRLDPRLREDQQTGERVYARNDIDRGHLVRRASAVWGDTRAEAAQANGDTFHYTNAAPQAAKFNQGLELWLGMESYLLDHAAGHRRRIVVFTGPIFSDVDPVYRGVDIPLRFFKVAAFIHEGELAATGYVVDQTPQLAEMPDVPRPGALDDTPPLGPFRTFQAPIRDIAELTGLDLRQLIAADRMPIAATLGAATVGSAWRELAAMEDLDLDFDLAD